MRQWNEATAIVTGAGSGIGRALCLAMASRGARVLVTDIDVERARQVAQACGERASACALDVRDAQAVQQRVEAFAGQSGRLDYMFNNAGIGVSGEVHEIPLTQWQNVIDINLMGVLHGVLAAYPIMVRQGSGHIVNTASLAGLMPVPLLTPYAMTKHAVVGLSTSLRQEAAALGVRVSALCPAAIETPLLDLEPTPGVPWVPDTRRYLTAAAGAPYPVDLCAAETLRAVDANKGLIVLPARARVAWKLGAILPGLVEMLGLKRVADERATRHQNPDVPG